MAGRYLLESRPRLEHRAIAGSDYQANTGSDNAGCPLRAPEFELELLPRSNIAANMFSRSAIIRR